MNYKCMESAPKCGKDILIHDGEAATVTCWGSVIGGHGWVDFSTENQSGQYKAIDMPPLGWVEIPEFS